MTPTRPGRAEPLVTLAAVTSFLLAALLFLLNYGCVTRQIDDPRLRPGTTLRVWAVLGIAGAITAAGLLLYVQFLG